MNPLDGGISRKFEETTEELKQQELDEVNNEPQVIQDGEAHVVLASVLLDLFGSEGLERLKNSDAFQVPFTDDTSDLRTWMINALRMLFKPAELEEMVMHQKKWQKQWDEKTRKLEEEKETLEKELQAREDQKRQLEDDYLQADSERKQLRKDLLSGIPATSLINMIIKKGRSEDADRIAALLKEEAGNPSQGFVPFLLGFLEHWSIFITAIENCTDDEDGMEKLHGVLSGLLEKISGTTIPQRRPILEIVAGMCSEKFTNYKFISPEGSLQVDPRIHAATALGGSTIKEGITFVVIKKDNMQTVKYAEIRV